MFFQLRSCGAVGSGGTFTVSDTRYFVREIKSSIELRSLPRFFGLSLSSDPSPSLGSSSGSSSLGLRPFFDLPSLLLRLSSSSSPPPSPPPPGVGAGGGGSFFGGGSSPLGGGFGGSFEELAVATWTAVTALQVGIAMIAAEATDRIAAASLLASEAEAADAKGELEPFIRK